MSPVPDDPRAVWSALCDLVLANVRRKEAADAVGLSFSKVRALRQLARHGPMSMGDLAGSLGVDAPNATVLVDDHEARGQVSRHRPPDDRRTRLVDVTRAGRSAAARAQAILETPPPGFDRLDTDELAALARVVGRLASVEKPAGTPAGHPETGRPR
jgi:DNA-binding MarR family transcriptional regulator